MNILMSIEVTQKVAKCPVCGDETIGNGSKLIIKDASFERTCRECGWRITGLVEGDEIVITSDNRSELDKH